MEKYRVLLLCGGILFAGFCFLLCRFYIPLRKAEQKLAAYRETGNRNELKNCIPHQFPELMRFMEEILKESDSGMLSELKLQRARYLALENQIHPHFLFNTLEDIRGDALEAGMQGLAQTIGALATYFRYTIVESENLVWLEEEMDNIEDYYTIQRYRFGDRISLVTELKNEHLGYPRVKIPKLTLQPIIENAVSHGLESRLSRGIVKIVIDSTQKDLLIRVSDNGAGMDPEAVEEINRHLKTGESASKEKIPGKKHTGIALYNVDSRVRLLFGEGYGVHVYSAKGIGTEVEIRIPLIEENYGRIDSNEPVI